MQFGGWYVTRRNQIVLASVVVWFAVLDVLVLLGYEGALALLGASVSFLAGHLLAGLAASPIKQRFARRFGAWGGTAALVFALALVLAILLLGTYLTGSLPLPSEEGGLSGMFVYGLALGFGSTFRRRLSPPPQGTPEENQEARRAEVRTLLVVGGAVAGLFALSFTTYVLIEYVIGPAVRLFSS